MLISLELIPLDSNYQSQMAKEQGVISIDNVGIESVMRVAGSVGSVAGSVGGAVVDSIGMGAVVEQVGAVTRPVGDLAVETTNNIASMITSIGGNVDHSRNADAKQKPTTLPFIIPYRIHDIGQSPLQGVPKLVPSNEQLPEFRKEIGIQPMSRTAQLHMFVIGLRGLRPLSNTGNSTITDVGSALGTVGSRTLSSIRGSLPFIEMGVGEFHRKGEHEVTSTRPCNKPSSENPTYAEHLHVALALPNDPIFMPTADIKVYDKLFGGLAKPLLGSCSLPLAKYNMANGEPARAKPSTDRASIRSAPTLHDDADESSDGMTTEEVLETWENQRKTARGWSASDLLPCDPPKWSEVDATLPHPNREQGVPPAQWISRPKESLEDFGWTEWEWVDDAWNKEEWGYAVTFEPGGLLELFEQTSLDVIRRRRWYRRRRRVERRQPQDMIGAGLASLERMSVTSMQAVRGERLKNGALKLQQTLPGSVGPLDPTTSHGAMPDTNVSNLQPASNTVSSGQEKNGLDADEDSDEELQASGLKWLRMDLTRAELKQGQLPMTRRGLEELEFKLTAKLELASDPADSIQFTKEEWDALGISVRPSDRIRVRLKRGDEFIDLYFKPSEDDDLTILTDQRKVKEDKAQEGIEQCEQALRELLQRQNALEREKRQVESGSARVKLSKKGQALRLANRRNRARVEQMLIDTRKELSRYEGNLCSEQLLTPLYMLNRQRKYYEAERDLRLSELPYERLAIMCGQGSQAQQVATLKAFTFLLLQDPERPRPLGDEHMARIMPFRTPNKYVVRLYVLRSLNMPGDDKGGAADIYLNVNLGERALLTTRDKPATGCFNTAEFFEVVEVEVDLPGDATMTCEVWGKRLAFGQARGIDLHRPRRSHLLSIVHGQASWRRRGAPTTRVALAL